ncbi:polysaccharide deacetylase family protein [Piscibacillus halophilus]|uniref:Peptidoglycan/xylan/chitin deacetylase, PgdA/CDA1 family n=1 Tax=Piscibacillus halophilus TaxID=571933 RepID=A0A1H9FSQ3_9BACI|nr:polysaccharide deacetylase family protein [Piscibacillus halophilus]SEQ40925.1 Peptidoglycan/xylan/chitin deacetylase, PgdA/CDA1 family [Piscibacillus halophilus]
MVKQLFMLGCLGITCLSMPYKVEGERAFPVYEVNRDYITGLPDGYVALTFDDGPSEYTKDIADILAEHGVAGTFFFIGKNIEDYPEIVRYVEEQGHIIGSHSYDHRNLNELTPPLLENDILESITGLEGLVGRQVELFRPPFGSADDEVVEVIKENGLKTVMWNRDPKDWEAENAQDIVSYFSSVDSSGGIYILHENAETVRALPQILSHLESEDLQVVGLQ